jgi:ribose 5-phosphate isomerase RpiB
MILTFFYTYIWTYATAFARARGVICALVEDITHAEISLASRRANGKGRFGTIIRLGDQCLARSHEEQ